jgi:hypothetical protein
LEQPWVNDHKKNINAVGVGEVDRGLANAFSVGYMVLFDSQGSRKLNPGLELANAFGVQIPSGI